MERQVPFSFSPRSVAFDAVTLLLCGPYVRVRPARAAAAPAAPATTTLRDLEPYVVLPAEGWLAITRDGAVFHEPTTRAPDAAEGG